MASPDKESLFIVVERGDEEKTADVLIAHFPTLDRAEASAQGDAKGCPGTTFTVFRAVADFEAGEVPVERTAYRQAASRKVSEE